jgi:hypothetical protein
MLISVANHVPSTSTTRTMPVLDARRVEDREFLAMQRAFAQSGGGLANGDDIARLMRRHSAQPLSTLARWIVDRRVVSFVWRGQTWLPLFQFDPDMQPRADACAIVAELVGVYDDWELALWFVQPSEWLDDATPLERFGANPFDVLQAARIDRFVANG